MEEKRICGGCTACCFTHGVSELDKQPLTPCTKCVTDGCSIYKSRPGSCRKFQCAWLRGIGEEDERPDIFGVVSTLTGMSLGEKVFAILVFHIFDVDLIDRNKLDAIIRETVKSGAIVIINPTVDRPEEKRKLFFSEELFKDEQEREELFKKILASIY